MSSLNSPGLVLKLALAVILLAGIALPARVLAVDSDEAEAMVKRAYKEVLDRAPDKDGLKTYRSRIVDDDWSEEKVKEDLKKSPEYKKAKADRVIKRAYEDLLGRKADENGLKHYRKLMLEKDWTEKDVREDLKKSEEYKQKS